MDTGEVKISKTGKSGIPQMTYTRKVADFHTFIKSPEKFLKGTSVKTTDKVSSKPGDKDYKQLIGKLKMLGEQVLTYSADAATNPESLTKLNETLAEIKAINEEMEQSEPTADSGSADGSGLSKLEGKMKEYLSKLPEDKTATLKSEIEAAGFGGKSQEEIASKIQPNEAGAQAILDAAQGDTETAIAEAMIVENFMGLSSETVKKLVTKALEGIQVAGTATFFVVTILWAASDGHISELVKLVGEAGGLAALIGFVLHGAYAIIGGMREAK